MVSKIYQLTKLHDVSSLRSRNTDWTRGALRYIKIFVFKFRDSVPRGDEKNLAKFHRRSAESH